MTAAREELELIAEDSARVKGALLIRIWRFLAAFFAFFIILQLFVVVARAADLKLFDSFDSGAISATWGSALQVDTDHYTPNTAATTFVASPTHTGAMALHYYTLVGTIEKTPLQLNIDSTDFATVMGSEASEIYFEWESYFSSAYCWPGGSQKMLRIGYHNVSNPESQKEFGFGVQTSNTDVNIQGFCGLWGDSSACNVDFAEHSNDPHEEDEWVKWGAYIKLNTPGVSDGIIRLYKNDALYLDRSSTNLRGTDTNGFNYLWLGGNYSDGGGTLACSGSRYIDDVRIYDTIPTPTPTPGGGFMPFLQ